MEKRKIKTPFDADYLKGSASSGNYGHASTPGERGGSIATPIGVIMQVLNAAKARYGDDPKEWPSEVKAKVRSELSRIMGD